MTGRTRTLVGDLTDSCEPVYSQLHRSLVARREDPPPVRFIDPADMLDDEDRAAFVRAWFAVPRDERTPYCLSRAQVEGRAPILGAGAWLRARKGSL